MPDIDRKAFLDLEEPLRETLDALFSANVFIGLMMDDEHENGGGITPELRALNYIIETGHARAQAVHKAYIGLGRSDDAEPKVEGG